MDLSGSVVVIVAKKEIVEALRDGRLRFLSIVVILLGLTAFGFGARQMLDAQNARETAMERAKMQWEGQGKKNPHVAGHFGTYVFAPISVTTSIDPGVSSQLGRSIKMEAHRQNLPEHSRARDSGLGSQLGGFSVSLILLKLFPILIIAMGYGLWSRERESGTLRQLLSTGVSRWSLFAGKFIGLYLLIIGIVLPTALCVLLGLSLMVGMNNDVFLRLLVLGGGCALYFGFFAGLTLAVSALVGSSQFALVGLVLCWGILCLLIPRVSSESAKLRAPLPSRAELSRPLNMDLRRALIFEATRDDAVDALVEDILAEQGFANAGFMLDPAIARGAELHAEARWEDQVFGHHVGLLNDAIARQERGYSVFGWASPFIAMSTISASLCGTDFNHHRHFSDAAESWRKSFIYMLNETFAKDAGADGWNYKAGPEVWKKAPPFRYESPTLWFAVDKVV